MLKNKHFDEWRSSEIWTHDLLHEAVIALPLSYWSDFTNVLGPIQSINYLIWWGRHGLESTCLKPPYHHTHFMIIVLFYKGCQEDQAYSITSPKKQCVNETLRSFVVVKRKDGLYVIQKHQETRDGLSLMKWKFTLIVRNMSLLHYLLLKTGRKPKNL